MTIRYIACIMIIVFLSACAPQYVWHHPVDNNRYNGDVYRCDMYAQNEKLNAMQAFGNSPFAGMGMIAAYDRAFENCMFAKGWEKVVNEDVVVPTQTSREGDVKLYELGEEAYKNERYDEALDYLNRSLKISRSLKAPIGIAMNLSLMGFVYKKLERKDEALKVFKEAFKLYKKLKKTGIELVILKEMGSIYASLGQFEEALICFNDALELSKRINVPMRENVAILDSIGETLEALKRYEEALKYREEALTIYRTLDDPFNLFATLTSIGDNLTSLGKFEKALSYYEDALKVSRNINKPEVVAISLGNMGKINELLLQHEKGLSYLKEALAIWEKADNKQMIAEYTYEIGSIYSSLDQYEEALRCYEEAITLWSRLNNQNVVRAMNGMGLIYARMGQYEKALVYYEKVFKIAIQLDAPLVTASVLNNFGEVYRTLEFYEKALLYHEKALSIFRDNKKPQQIANSLINIGLIYLAQKQYHDAEERFIEAEKQIVQTGLTMRGNPGMAEIFIATARYNDALKLLEDMDYDWNSASYYRIQLHTQRGYGLKGMGKLSEASSEFLKVVSLSEELRQRVKEKSGFYNNGAYGGRIRAYKGLVTTLAERVIKGEKEDQEFSLYGKDLASSTFYFAELTKARALLEAMAGSAKKSSKGTISADLGSQEKNILSQLSAIEDQWEDTYKKGEDAFKELVQRKEALKKELGALIVILRNKYPFYAALNYPRPIPPDELRLRDNEVLIEYAVADDAVYVFVVRKNGVKSIEKTSISKDSLVEKVTTFMEPLNTGRYSGFSVKAANELYYILLSKALASVKETDRIILVPDGILGLLPFEALVMNQGKDCADSLYVGDKWTITYSQSATALALTRMLKPSKAKKPLFALGNPVYDKDDSRYVAYKQGKAPQVLASRNLDHGAYRGITVIPKSDTVGNNEVRWEEVVYSALPETETEVKEIAKLFHTKPVSPDVLLNINANESGFRKTTIKDYRYLHFATHADLPGKVQGIKEPFLLLGQVENKAGDDGFLTLSEVLELGLDADMVVLSACSTGKGKVMEGEGVANFARAFQQAGARSVVVSLWEVASDPAVEFMKAYYGYLKNGHGRADALTLARRQIKSKYPNPFYWAVFIMHGEGGANKAIH